MHHSCFRDASLDYKSDILPGSKSAPSPPSDGPEEESHRNVACSPPIVGHLPRSKPGLQTSDGKIFLIKFFKTFITFVDLHIAHSLSILPFEGALGAELRCT